MTGIGVDSSTTTESAGRSGREALATPFPSRHPISTDPVENVRPVRLGDRLFRGCAGSGVLVVVIVAVIGVFLLSRAVPALRRNRRTSSSQREVGHHDTRRAFGILDLLWSRCRLGHSPC